MTKLLQINTVVNWGSTGRIAEEIGEMAISQGWDSYIAYGRKNATSHSNLIRVGNIGDVWLHAIQTRLFDNHGLASKKATRRFVEQINEIKPDIVHLHNIHGYYLNYQILFACLARMDVPVVWTLHDCWSFTGHCGHYSRIGCYRWLKGCYDCPQQRECPVSLLKDRSVRNYHDKKVSFTSLRNLTLVPVSQWLANEVGKSFLRDSRIEVIHNGIDTKLFDLRNIRKAALGLEDKFMVLGLASVWYPQKGLDDFIRLRQMLSDDYQIVLVGLHPKQIRTLPKGIVGIARTNSVEELARYYSLADVFFNPSVEETFGLTTVEAMACGTPVIVYNATACSEAVDSNTGFVVEPGNLKDVVEKIFYIRLVGKDAFSIACRARVLSFYDKQDRFAEYLNLYQELINEKKSE